MKGEGAPSPPLLFDADEAWVAEITATLDLDDRQVQRLLDEIQRVRQECLAKIDQILVETYAPAIQQEISRPSWLMEQLGRQGLLS